VNLNALLRAEGNLAFEDNTASRATDLLYSLKNAIKGTSLYEIVPDRLRGTVKQQLPSRTELDEIIDWQRTRAYSFGAGGNIYLNLEGRERDGLVPESEYEAVRATVASLLEALTDPETGDKVVGSVSYRESVYKGPYLHEAPDIVLRPATGYYLTSKHGTDVFERQTALMPNSGMHEREGVLLADGPDISAGAGGQNDIYDVAPTILHLQGKTVPESMDGSVIEELIEDDRPVTRGPVEKPEKRRIQSRVLALRQLGRI
jgi:predicted AlkP superfamily phosphohydrolase/phosphomutase